MTGEVYAVQDYTQGAYRTVRLRIDLDNVEESIRSRQYFQCEVSRYGGKPFTVEIIGYGAIPVEEVTPYLNLLATAADLAKRLNKDPTAPHGFHTA